MKKIRSWAAGLYVPVLLTAFLIGALNGQAVSKALAIVVCTATTACSGGHNKGKGAGVEGISATDIGVLGSATSGLGVKGTAKSGYGVEGVSTSSLGMYASGDGGVEANGNNYAGVFGESANSYGVEGSGINEAAVAGFANGSSPAVVASGNSGDALDATTGGGVGAYVSNSSGNGIDSTGSYIGVIGRAPASGGFPLVATDSAGNDLFYVDGGGDVYYHGSLNTFVRTANGSEATAYQPKSTSPSIEDTGTARLMNGVAIVPLDPTFAKAIDPREAYHVMLTPDGDTRGLFVASKERQGFVVREVMGGRSSLVFDYHIYATALGHEGERMTIAARKSTGPRAPRIVREIPRSARYLPVPQAR